VWLGLLNEVALLFIQTHQRKQVPQSTWLPQLSAKASLFNYICEYKNSSSARQLLPISCACCNLSLCCRSTAITWTMGIFCSMKGLANSMEPFQDPQSLGSSIVQHSSFARGTLPTYFKGSTSRAVDHACSSGFERVNNEAAVECLGAWDASVMPCCFL
jgi:hypothetical protein